MLEPHQTADSSATIHSRRSRILALALTALAVGNVALVPYINGSGFSESVNGYWPLHRQPAQDLLSIALAHPQRSISGTWGFYLLIGSRLDPSAVIAPQGCLNELSVQAWVQATLVSETYRHELSESEALELDGAPGVDGIWADGTEFRILDGTPRRPVRTMTFQGRIYIATEHLLRTAGVTW